MPSRDSGSHAATKTGIRSRAGSAPASIVMPNMPLSHLPRESGVHDFRAINEDSTANPHRRRTDGSAIV